MVIFKTMENLKNFLVLDAWPSLPFINSFIFRKRCLATHYTAWTSLERYESKVLPKNLKEMHNYLEKEGGRLKNRDQKKLGLNLEANSQPNFQLEKPE